MTTSASSAIPRVFDRALHRKRIVRAAPGLSAHDFLFAVAADSLADRLADVSRRFPDALVLGDRSGRATVRISDRPGARSLVAAGPGGADIVAEEDALPFGDASFDLIVSNLGLHWIDDLPGALSQIRRCLRPDGLFLAALLGGDTLRELRACLVDAELAILGGASARVSPMAGVRDLGNLLVRAGFALPVADTEPLTVTYADPLALMRDLRGMGETAAPAGGVGRPLRRDVLLETMRRYASEHADSDGRIRATFEVIHLAGWAPHPDQPKPLRPGSATARLADALRPDNADGLTGRRPET